MFIVRATNPMTQLRRNVPALSKLSKLRNDSRSLQSWRKYLRAHCSINIPSLTGLLQDAARQRRDLINE